MKKEMKKDYHETDNRLAEISAVFTEILESIFGENAPIVEVVLTEPQEEAKGAEETESGNILELMLEKDCDITQQHVKWLRTLLSGEKDPEQDYMDTIYEELLHDLLDFTEMLECLAMMLLLVSEGKDCSREDLTVASEISTPGNGDLGDEIPSGKKDFYTIHTKNNNTFYLVVDHAGNTDNVYMLSLIDEGDLSEFLDAAEKETEPEPQVVILPEITKEPESEPVITPEPAKEKNSNTLSLAVLALIALGGAYYYFKVYKPKKDSEHIASEGMESAGEGMNTVNEDKENE